MSDSDGDSVEKREAIRHLESALSTEDATEADYHIRQALQLLDVE